MEEDHTISPAVHEEIIIGQSLSCPRIIAREDLRLVEFTIHGIQLGIVINDDDPVGIIPPNGIVGRNPKIIITRLLEMAQEDKDIGFSSDDEFLRLGMGGLDPCMGRRKRG
jgi:hypothetical protein